MLTPSITAVSDTFHNYARQNPTSPQVLVFGGDDDIEIQNQLYIPRGNGSEAGIAAVGAPPSTMFTQTLNGTVPVTVSKSYGNA